MGNGITFPAKLRPVFLQRLDEIKARRHVSQIKDPTPSKKELLLHGSIEDDHDASSNSYHHHHDSIYNNDDNVVKYEEPSKEKDHVRPKQEQDSNLNNVTSSISADEGKKREVVVREEKEHHKGRFNDLMEDSTEEDDDEDDERMIGYDGDDAFPGSPSFRVYFDGDEKDQNPKVKNKDLVSRNDMPLSKDLDLDLVEGKKVKRGRKRRSFKGVFPKGGHMKNLLHVTSCYTSCHTSRDHHQAGAQARLVSEKPNKHDS